MTARKPQRRGRLPRLGPPGYGCAEDTGVGAVAATGTLMPGAEAIHPIKLNGVDPQAWLADVLARLPDHPAKRVDELLPWNWKVEAQLVQMSP